MTVPLPIVNPLLNQSGVAHGFFTRQGGASRGLYATLNCGPGSSDDPTAVEANRRRVVERLLGSPGPLATLYQVHGRTVVTVTEPFPTGYRPQADALVTRTPGIVIGVLTADCTPVLFADPAAGVIGAAHAGWKGALLGVIEATIETMEAMGATREHICAAVGPTIAQASYEVDEGFRARFVEADPWYERFFIPGRPGHTQFDLPAFVEHRLRAAKVGFIENLGLDTYADETRFFSYRRATHRREPDYGRQISAIALKSLS